MHIKLYTLTYKCFQGLKIRVHICARYDFFCNFASCKVLQSNIHNILLFMVKHIILWTLNPELTAEEKAEVKRGIKEGLEGLAGQVPGLLDIRVVVDGRLESSNCDVMLDSTLESPEALRGYAVHPAHVAVADSKVRPYTVQRTCLDYETE